MIRTTPPRDPYNIGGSVPLRIGPTVKIAVWTLYQLRQIPATSCSAERSYSALRRIKMYLRNTMKEERLSAVAILNIERENTNFIEANRMDNIIDKLVSFDIFSLNDLEKKLPLFFIKGEFLTRYSNQFPL